MKGLDLSKFKKVSEGKDKTTLQHPDGHQIMIAHSALSSKMREQLKNLSSAKPKMMASGGLPEEAPVEGEMPPTQGPVEGNLPPMEGQAPATPSDIPPAPMDADQSSPAKVTEAAKPEGLAVIAQKKSKRDEPAQQEVSGRIPETTPSPAIMIPSTREVAPVAPPKPTFQQVKMADAQKYNQEAELFNQDLTRGIITPKTYSSLFADQSTLGKVGSVFGMLLSGMGSALAGQPNAFMAIMDKQIENDLAAQRQNITNHQSFYQMNLQRELNQASIAKQKADELMVQANITKIPEEKAILQAQAKQIYEQANQIRQSAQIDAQTNSYNQAMAAAFHSLANSPQAQTPEGQQALGMMYMQVQKSIVNKNDAAAGMKAMLSITGAQQSAPEGFGGGNVTSVDYPKMRQLQMTKLMPEGDVAAAREEASKIEQSHSQEKMFMESFNHLNSITGGKQFPADRKASVETLGQFMPKDKVESLMPQPFDKPTTRENKKAAIKKYFELQRTSTPVLKQYGLVKTPKNSGTPANASNNSKPPAGGAKDGTKSKDKNGRTIIRVNGQWRYEG